MLVDLDLETETKRALTALVFRAKRCVPVVGNDEYPTPWDNWHAQMNELLDDLFGQA